MAQVLSEIDVPVFMADVKGDLSGMAKAGSETHKLHAPFMERNAKIGFDDFAYADFPVTFWDLFGNQGHPVRTTLAEMSPAALKAIGPAAETLAEAESLEAHGLSVTARLERLNK